MPSFSTFRTIQKSAVIGIGVALITIIVTLLIANYRSQTEYQRFVLDRFKQNVEKQAGAISCFFSERKSDLKELAEMEKLAVYFENKALGMSMKYGLWESLDHIAKVFDRFLEGRRLGNERTYTRIVLVEKSGEVLVDRSVGNPHQANERDLKEYLHEEQTEPYILTEPQVPFWGIMVSIPYFFKGAYAGQIIAWISSKSFYHQLVKVESESSKLFVNIKNEKGQWFYTPVDLRGKASFPGLPAFSDAKEDIQRFNHIGEDGIPVETIVFQLPIMNTPFFMVIISPAREVFGHASPRQLLTVVGMFSLGILGGLSIIWQFATRRKYEREREVAERQKAEVALAESEEEYRSIFNNAQAGIYRIRISDGKMLAGNNRLAQIFGYENHAEFLQEFVSSKHYVDPGTREKILESLQKRDLNNVEARFYRKDGSIIWLLFSARIHPGKDYIEGVMIDITKRKQAEAEVQRRNEELAVQSEQLRALSARLAALEESERKKIARELHDLVGQNLTALGLNLSFVLNQISEEKDPLISTRLKDSIDLAEKTTGYIRHVMAELRPPMLDDYGLMAALRWYGQQYSNRTGMAVEVQGKDITPRLTATKENALFRIVQEALTNASKHAKATRVEVKVEADDQSVRLSIADNGVGFDPSLIGESGLGRWGLMEMREQAMAAQGLLRIESEPGKGTRIAVEVSR